MAHSDQHYKSIGRLLSDLKNQNLTQVAQKYIRQLMDALSKPATPKQHTNTLMHIQGYLKKLISGEDKEKLNQVDRKSTRLNSSHVRISYAVFCLKKKKKN